MKAGNMPCIAMLLLSRCLHTCIPGRDGLVKVKHQHWCVRGVNGVLNDHLQVCCLLGWLHCCWAGRVWHWRCLDCCDWPFGSWLLLLLPQAVRVAMAPEPVEHVEATLQDWPHIRDASNSLEVQQDRQHAQGSAAESQLLHVHQLHFSQLAIRRLQGANCHTRVRQKSD